MCTDEEKEWLRAVLEQRIKPGDAEWERIWREECFRGVRKALRELGEEKETWHIDQQKMWAVIDRRCRADIRRRRFVFWRGVAAVLLPALVAGSAWLLWRRDAASVPVPVVSESVIAAGMPQAVLLLSNGEKVDLTALGGDTVLTHDQVNIRVDSSCMVKYDATETAPVTPVYNTIIVPRRGEYRLALADGTRVYLNAESELRFPVHFTGKHRRVWLKGEGYFEVSKDSLHPFVVMAGGTEVTVLGTEFNVNAYDASQLIRTTLVSGKVEVSDRLTREKALLHPSQQAEWRPDRPVKVKEVEVSDYVSWITGKYYFDGSTLEEISEQIRRWYDLEFFFTSEELKHSAFAGVIDREYTANEIFTIIEKTTRVKFELKGKTVVVKKR
ncbi:MAG: DUF4974 domain-containing protein [Odoribacter sp.]|nr:DUF4974 domain-containing protein [Odoribacter sp.]